MSWYTLANKRDTVSTPYTRMKGASYTSSASGSTSIQDRILAMKKANTEKVKEDLKKEQEELERVQQQMIEDKWYAYEDNYVNDALTHQLNLAYIATTTNYKKGHRYKPVKGSFNAASVDFNKNNNAISFDSFASQGLKYSTSKGQKLAKDVANNSVGWTGYCSRYTSNSLANTGLGNERAASAYMMAGKLANNKNFQEISAAGIDLRKLPAGCVLVYDKGAAGYNSQHGHIEITLGDGTACSDGRTYNIRSTQNMRIFVPVENA